MASKEYVLMALGDPHLRAIGKVAANWSALETTILHALSEMSKVEYETLLVLVGVQNILSWCEMLKGISRDAKAITGHKTELDLICSDIAEWHAKRNHIVHCSWQAPYRLTPGMGLLGVMPLPAPRTHEKAKGHGLKRKSHDPIRQIAFSAKEMLTVAKKVTEVQGRVREWARQWRLAHPPKVEPGWNVGLLEQGRS